MPDTMHKWRFFRAGGFDQVNLGTGADLLHLQSLDQKLWVALSCPVHDLEFDARTLELIDTDHDGHIRVKELTGAVAWACSALKDPGLLLSGHSRLPLSAIDDGKEEGRQILSSARQILASLGKSDEESITLEDAQDEENIFSQTRFNGDGIITAGAADDDEMKSVIKDIIACLGPDKDRSGADGISQAKADRFFTEAQAFCEWETSAKQETCLLPFGDKTRSASDAFLAVKAKVDDYFIRCRLAEFDPRSALPLNPAETDYEKLSGRDLSASSGDIAVLPVAAIRAGSPLPLDAGVNPAWADAIAKLKAEVIKPAFGEKSHLTADEWSTLTAKFAALHSWLASKPQTAVEQLGPERIREIAGGSAKAVIDGLISKDIAFKTEMEAISSVEKLLRYCRDLATLLNNFVAFRDFYTFGAKAIFQAGTLYIDGRSCDLCVKVVDVNRHVALGTLSRLYLVYCDCTSRGGAEKMTVAAAVTAGDSDQLMTGRNGVFYDRKGQDWDATIVRIVDHPISVRQAFWSPYKRISRMVGEQFLKIGSSRSKAMEDRAAAGLADAHKPKEQPAAQPFDVGKFAGIFAAIGLAIGAIGTALASVVAGLLRLAWWQVPIAIAGLILAISGPSMAIAWFKLRQRNLGPILDANGWAVNSRARINIAFGAALTATAKLPEGSERPLLDPFADKKSRWPLYLVLAAIALTVFLLRHFGPFPKW